MFDSTNQRISDDERESTMIDLTHRKNQVLSIRWYLHKVGRDSDIGVVHGIALSINAKLDSMSDYSRANPATNPYADEEGFAPDEWHTPIPTAKRCCQCSEPVVVVVERASAQLPTLCDGCYERVAAEIRQGGVQTHEPRVSPSELSELKQLSEKVYGK